MDHVVLDKLTAAAIVALVGFFAGVLARYGGCGW